MKALGLLTTKWGSFEISREFEIKTCNECMLYTICDCTIGWLSQVSILKGLTKSAQSQIAKLEVLKFSRSKSSRKFKITMLHANACTLQSLFLTSLDFIFIVFLFEILLWKNFKTPDFMIKRSSAFIWKQLFFQVHVTWNRKNGCNVRFFPLSAFIYDEIFL